MPELPEVESIKLQLQKFLVGHTVEGIAVNYAKVFEGDTNDLLRAKVKNIRRFGKVLCLDFSNGNSLLIHIKLTGQLIYRGPNLRRPPELSKKVSGGVPGAHTHVIFELDEGGHLYYNDFRKFGWMRVTSTDKVMDNSFIKKLGPEPFGKKTSKNRLTLPTFMEVLASTKRAVKVVIMDQSKIGGVGNIYANDALFLSKIDPRRPANSLDEKEARKLLTSIETVIRRGLEYGGASELSFVTPDGGQGEYQDHTLVYGKAGSVCKHGCGGKVVKFTLGGRGTYWCPTCQK